MAFIDGKERSKGFVKRVASSFSMRNKKTNATTSTRGGYEPKLLPRSKSTGSSSTNYESSKLKKVSDFTTKPRSIKPSASVITPLPRREKIDDRRGDGKATKKSFGKWRSFDDSDSVWLSSSTDCASPTSLLEERRFSVSFRFSVDESVVSWLSKLANSHQDASSIKDRRRIPKNTKENAENKKTDSSCDDSLSTMSSQGKRVSFSPSSGTELVASENSSPSLTLSSNVSSDPNTDAKSLDEKKSSIIDEPIFWPYEQRFDWTPEDILKHFTMSPRRKKSLSTKISTGNSNSPRSMRAQLLQTRKPDLKDGGKRKLIFNGPITNTSSKIPELKRTSSNIKKEQPIKNCVKRNKSLPSRLRKSSKTCSKVVPVDVVEEEEAKAETTKKLINRRSKTMLEDDFAFLNDLSIENAVGLDEFKGREGIDSEFNSDAFLFDDSL